MSPMPRDINIVINLKRSTEFITDKSDVIAQWYGLSEHLPTQENTNPTFISKSVTVGSGP